MRRDRHLRRARSSPRSRRCKVELEAARAGSDEYLAALQRERAEFQNFRRRTAEERIARAGTRRRGPDPQGPGRRRRLRSRHRGQTRVDRRGSLVRGDRRDRSQAAPAPRERGRDHDRRRRRPAVRSARARGDRQRPGLRPGRGRDRRGGPARLSTPRPRHSPGPGCRGHVGIDTTRDPPDTN